MNELLMRLCWDLQLGAAVLEDDMGDKGLAVLAKVMAAARTILPLIRDQVQLEFMNNSTEKDAILRGNCTATRMMTAYSNLVGMPWVCHSLGGPVRRLLAEPAVWVLDLAKATGATPEERLAQVQEGQRKLLEVATSFLKRLQKKIGLTPVELRCMAYFVWIHARTFCPERSTVLLGGFVFLRIVNPALVSPESVPKLLSADEVVPPSFKPNSIALCRLLQQLSNQTFYKDTAGCALLNDWLSANHAAMESFLLDLATDPEFVEGNRPFARFTRLPEERNRHLRENITAEEWDALHVALLRCKTHVIVKSALAPVLSASGLTSPKKGSLGAAMVGGGGPGGGGVSSSMPNSPNRSRSGSRFRGDDEELAIYGDGKMRMRPARRGSLSQVSLFANMSQPNLGVHSPQAIVAPSPSSAPNSSLAPYMSSADSSPGPGRHISQMHDDRSASATSLPRIAIGVRSRSRTHSTSGSPLAATPPVQLGSSAPLMAAHLRDPDTPPVAEESTGRAFFALLESLPAPPEIRREQFQELIEPLKRGNLVAEGVLSDGRRASVKLGQSQMELVMRLMQALTNAEYGLLVESFAQPLLAEWTAKWLDMDQPRDVESLLALMVKSGMLLEKGSKANKGYQLDIEKIKVLKGEGVRK
jgi:hypothetical protein